MSSNQERKDSRISRMVCLEPGKEGCKDKQDALSWTRKGRMQGLAGYNVFEPGKEGFKDIQDPANP